MSRSHPNQPVVPSTAAPYGSAAAGSYEGGTDDPATTARGSVLSSEVVDSTDGGGDAPRTKTKKASKKRKPRKVLKRTLITLLFLTLLGGVGAVAAFAIVYSMTPIPEPNRLVTSNTSIIYFADGKTPMGSFAAQNRVTVPLTEVPKHVQDAMLSAENRTFWTDKGISIPGIARAMVSDLSGQHKQGASTITQQYVKNYYLTQDRTWSRKTKELFITLKVQRKQSKEQILEDYLNTIYFGRGAYGIQTASEEYFGKPVKQLSVEEGAVLASMARAPSNYDPAVDSENLKRLEGRFRYVMNGLAEMKEVSADRAATAKLPKPVDPKQDEQYAGYKGYLLRQVRSELTEMGYTDRELDSGGLRVTTTFDEKAMEAAKVSVEKNMPKSNAKGVHAGLASVDPKTGGLVAIYGGEDYLKRSFNDATQAKVEPGSTFKTFALAAALEKDISLKSNFAGNSPFRWGGQGKVNNEFDQDFGQSVSLLKATEKSINTAFVDLTVNKLGPERVVDAAVAAGIPRDAPGLGDHPLVALGNASATPAEMANAYATFANGGTRHNLHTVEQVATRTGEIRDRADVGNKRAFDPEVTRDVNYALQQVVQQGTGYTARELGRPAAGKTGTHEDRTAWFAGYTPQLSTTVAFYREDSKGNRDSLDYVGGESTFTGGGFPTEIWTAYMERVLKGEPVKKFEPAAWVGKLGGRDLPTKKPTTSPDPDDDNTPTDGPTTGPSPTWTPTDPPSPTETWTPTAPPTEDDPEPTNPNPSPTGDDDPPPPLPQTPNPRRTTEPPS